MAFSASDIVLFRRPVARTDPAEQVKASAEKIITKHDESYVARIDGAIKGLDDVIAGKVKDVKSVLMGMRLRRSAKTQG